MGNPWVRLILMLLCVSIAACSSDTSTGEDNDNDNEQTIEDSSDFTPATGKAEDGTQGAYGPWNLRLRIATSQDAVTWTRTDITLTDQGDVPNAIVHDGQLWLFM